MTASVLSENYSITLVGLAPESPPVYSLEEAARLAGVHPAMLGYFCRLGLFGESRAVADAELEFDDDALFELRRFEHYRRHHGVDRKTLRLICGLRREVERLRADLRFLRGA